MQSITPKRSEQTEYKLTLDSAAGLGAKLHYNRKDE